VRPGDIGAIAGVYREVGPPKPTPRLDYMYAGTPEYRSQISKVESLERQLKPHVVGGVYTSPAITAFERKWSGKIKGGQFVGTDAEYRKYQRELATTQRTQERELAPYTTATKRLEGMEPAYESRYAALTKEYDEYTRAREKQEELRAVSIVGRYERAEERGGKAIAARIPTVSKMLAPARTPEIEAESKRVYAEYRRMFGMPAEPFKWERKVGVAEAEYKRGIVEGIREKPIKTIVTGAAFTALPPVLKGAKYAFKPVAKVGVKAFPRAAPLIGKWTPRAVGVGLGAAYGISAGYSVYKAPPGMRAAEAGRITGTELLPMGLGTAVGVKAMAFRIPSVQRPRMPELNIEKAMAKVYRDARIAQSKYIPRKYRVKVRKAPAVRDIPYVRGVEGYMAKVYRDARIAQSKYIPRKYRVPVRRKPESEMSKVMRDFGTFMRSRRGGVVLAPSKPKIPKLKEKPVWEVPELVPRRGIGGREILMGKEPYVPKVEPYKYEDITTFEGFEKPTLGRIEVAEGKSRLEIIKEISETTDIARKKALETKLAESRPVSRRGQPVEDWGGIWKKREVETAKRIKAGELQVQEMAGGELGLLQITKTVKVPKIKTIEAA
ncbi:MAG: hypothetical protein JJE19_08395, partial [Methanosarcinales archaeon]|nr:hypothetical protein [Methanosarcinales archaeon]